VNDDTCGLCGRTPAAGFAMIGDVRYCHPDQGKSCYVAAQTADPLIASLTAENEQLFHDNIDLTTENDRMRVTLAAIRQHWNHIVVLELGDDVPVAAFPLAHHEAIERLLNGQTT